MSGTLPPPFNQFTGGGSPLMLAQPSVQPPAPQQPAPQFNHRIPMHATRQYHANQDQATLIKKRDAMGDVAHELAKIANAPDDDINRADIVAYLGGMVGKGIIPTDEAAAILRTLPEDQDGIRSWARMMFSAAMNIGIHTHAAYPKAIFPGEGQQQQATTAAPAVAGAEEQAETVR